MSGHYSCTTKPHIEHIRRVVTVGACFLHDSIERVLQPCTRTNDDAKCVPPSDSALSCPLHVAMSTEAAAVAAESSSHA